MRGIAISVWKALRERWQVRDVYKGVKHAALDLTAGLAAGPYGDPSRFDMVPALAVGGSFPRAISMFRTSYSARAPASTSRLAASRLLATRHA